MNHNPDFFLTAAGEYKPLAEPRACWVKERLRDAQDNDYVIADIRPPFCPTDAPLDEVSLVVLSARHRGESVAHITSWPIYVYVSRVLTGAALENATIEKWQLRVVAWGRLYRSIEGAAHDAERHAAALPSARSPQTIHAEQIRFVGEQDGIPEQALKEGLVRLLAPEQRIWKAYLARTDFGPGTTLGVTLYLRTAMGPDNALVARIGEVFAPLFRSGESLDILFIDDEQEHDVSRVCKPFYVRTVSRRA